MSDSETRERQEVEMNYFETWERQEKESSMAFSAFCAFRDCGPQRTIIKACEDVEKDKVVAKRKYRTWRYWAAHYHWVKRAADYDNYLDKVKLAERIKKIKEREERHLQTAEKILTAVDNKLDTMSKEELSQGNVTDWYKTAVQTEREVLGIAREEGGEKQLPDKNFEVKFDSAFKVLKNEE